MDVCVVLYRCGADRVVPGLRSHDHLWLVDNTRRNIGFAAGANEAARRGRDALIGFVNPDGYLTTDCLNRLEEAFADEAVVACEPDMGVWNREPRANGDMEWLSGACLVVRREAFQKVGGFDERLFMYCEDIDLSYKLAAHGRLVHVPSATFAHDGGKRPFRSLHRYFRNHLVVQRRHKRADTMQVLRDASFSVRNGELLVGLARITGIADYAIRARRWA